MVKKSSPDIYGLIGYPVKHSLSPLMHNAAFNTLEINAEYRLFEVEPAKLEAFLLDNIKVLDTQGKEFCSQDIIGFNITIPHKIKAKEILETRFPVSQPEQIFPYVKWSGAVNTVKRKADGTVDYKNTDVTGFSKSLSEDLKFNPKDKNILLIGCGGAGRAVVAGLIWEAAHPKKIYIYEPNSEAETSARKHFQQFSVLSEKTKFILKEQIAEIIKECQLLVNASPVGMRGEDISVIDKDWLHRDLYVYDVVYNRDQETRLIRDAKSKGLRTVNGLSMLLHQGADAFQLWTGWEAPVEIMRKALNEGASG